ncbi:MAG: hypothetical protein QG656_1471 [Candidatus Hydrogenedentes bacterium]|nr:hypothetical protein [Candidatus Hydrogenedentota bacterium]
MTELTLEHYTIPAAYLGPENPLPMFRDVAEDSPVEFEDSVPVEDRAHMGWRTGFRVLPYRMQDDYNRVRKPRAFQGVVLENPWLRATFLPEINGRLASLVHKPSGRQLLHRNPVFQPSNLALRNAWISGGIEWNMGQLGHNYFTCAPVFAAALETPSGEPVFRIYEWERAKRFPWQIDFHLPADSPLLFAHVRLVNPHDYEIPMYWWSNIAVDEVPGARVLVPAGGALRYGVSGRLGLVPLPVVKDVDISYPTNAEFAHEIFSRIPDGSRRWITQLNPDGTGLFQVSTDRLKGRKMFCWGMNSGGRRWQEFLAETGEAYVEIQAGLARTQLESIPMPARADWHWTEAYGLLEADPAKVHSLDWAEARQTVADAIDARLPRTQLDALDAEFTEIACRPAASMVAHGSPWAALERRRLAHGHEPDRVPAELMFPAEDLGEEQAPWLALLETGALPERDPMEEPGALMAQPEWQRLLEDAVAAGRGDHWLSWWHLGVMRLENGDDDGARQAWERSIERRANGWAMRNLAVLELRADRTEAARDLLRQAWETGPQAVSLALEYTRVLAKLEDDDAIDAFLASAPEECRAHERIRILAAHSALRQGRLDEVERLFDYPFATNREGETTLTDIWFGLHERRIAQAEGCPMDDALRQRVRREFPPPNSIDFRMLADR